MKLPAGKTVDTPPGTVRKIYSRPLEKDELVIARPARLSITEHDGMLTCNICEESPWWCIHNEFVLRNGFDAVPHPLSTDGINDPPSEATLAAMPEVLVVPIAPSHWLWATSFLGPIEDSFRPIYFRSAQVAFNERQDKPLPETHTFPLNDPLPMLGYLGAGEGRMIIRQMMLDWIKAQLHSVPACSSKLHTKLRWSKSDLRNQRVTGEDYCDILSLYLTKNCVHCSRISFSDFAQDAPRL